MAVVYEATIMSDYIDLFKTYLNGSITTTESYISKLIIISDKIFDTTQQMT